MINNKNPRPLPDFLGIGTQRSGTTWLYRHLSMHPEIWMPPIKEIHYFDRLYSSNRFGNTEKLFRDLKKRYQAYKSPAAMPENRRPNLRWDMIYFFRYPDIKWYSSLFIPGTAKITGEITPEYMRLDRKVVEKIYTHNPQLKIIFIMRDPIDRAWSAAIKYLAKTKRRDARTISDDEFLGFIQQRGTLLRSNYLRTLSIWESIFPAEQMHLEFYDEIQENPQEVLLRICEFLGIEASTAYTKKNLHKKIASTDRYKIKIPRAVEFTIAEAHIEQLGKLSQRFGGYPAKWLARSIKILKNYERHD
jgi:hypothetical protein